MCEGGFYGKLLNSHTDSHKILNQTHWNQCCCFGLMLSVIMHGHVLLLKLKKYKRKKRKAMKSRNVYQFCISFLPPNKVETSVLQVQQIYLNLFFIQSVCKAFDCPSWLFMCVLLVLEGPSLCSLLVTAACRGRFC